MGDDSERLHLEGLDEATERERWEEHFAAPTDLPDAVVEAAAEASHIAYEDAALEHGWETQKRSRVPWADVPEENKATVRVAIRAALAAASGPWAEQLDAAKADAEFWKDSDNKRSAKVRKMRAERDAARAELDNLRETLAQKIEAGGHHRPYNLGQSKSVKAWTRGMLDAAAIVRGSDDE